MTLGFDVPKQLVQDVVTRWNASFDMMLSFIEIKEPLNNVLHTDKWSAKVDQIYNSEWERMERVVAVFP